MAEEPDGLQSMGTEGLSTAHTHTHTHIYKYIYIYIYIYIDREIKRETEFKKICGVFPGGSVVKNPPIKAGDMGSILDPGRSHMPWNN